MCNSGLTIALLRSEDESLHESSELLSVIGHLAGYLDNDPIPNRQESVQLGNFCVAILFPGY